MTGLDCSGYALEVVTFRPPGKRFEVIVPARAKPRIGVHPMFVVGTHHKPNDFAAGQEYESLDAATAHSTIDPCFRHHATGLFDREAYLTSAVKVRPLFPHAALLLEDSSSKKFVVVSDLHIGIESELDVKGVSFGKQSAKVMASEISKLVKSESADSIVLLGDIKHKVGSITRQEWDEIPPFLNELSDTCQVYLVPGNHDGNIRHLTPPDVTLVSSSGMVIEDTLFVHGHTMPSNLRAAVGRMVMGHVHPVFLKAGSLMSGERVWIQLRARKDALFSGRGNIDVVVVPNFNPYIFAAGPRSYRKSISPILSRLLARPDAIEDCIVARLDGSIIGDSRMLGNVL